MNFGQPFWRPEPLEEWEQTLIRTLAEMHHKCTFRDNISTHAVLGAAQGSGDYGKALIAALATLGSIHAPLKSVMALLSGSGDLSVAKAIKSRKRVPGWGDSFSGENPDPNLEAIDKALAGEFPLLHRRIEVVTAALHNAGIKKHPNPACYTAAVAMLLRMPPSVAPFLFIVSRLPAWSSIFLQAESSHKLWEP